MYSASNPAKVQMEFFHFLKCDGKDLLVVLGALILSGIILFFSWQAALVLLGIGLFVVIFEIYNAKTLFAEGDVCPAMVIDPKRQLIAVLTDLSKGKKPFPVVKVLKQPLKRVTDGPFSAKTQLAFVAMYNGFPTEKRWRNFGGYLVNSGTTDPDTIDRVLESITDEQWQDLDDAVAELRKPYRPGLYEMF